MKRGVVLCLIVLCLVLPACVSNHAVTDTEPVSGPVSLDSRPQSYAIPLSYEAALGYRTDTADTQIKNIPQAIEAYRSVNVAEYVNQLASYIVRTSTNEYECVKKAHDWVVLNIHYDAISLLAGTIAVQDYVSVITRKLGMSEGMANVFKVFCDRMQIDCKIIRGYGRGYGNSPFDNEDPAKVNHFWNMVKIDGEGYFVDCTWDAGYLIGRSYVPRYSTEYFFPKPEYFAYSHFPEDSEYQLLEEKISAADFSSRPFLGPLFFDAINSLNWDLKKINQTGGKMVLDFSPAPGYVSNIEVYDESNGKKFENLTFVQREGEIYRAYFSFPGPGNYMIRCFSKKQNAARFSLSAEFGVSASAGSETLYPTQLPSFGPEVTIVSPLEMPLRRNITYEFKINAKENTHVIFIANNKTQNFFRDEEGLFVLNTAIADNVKEIYIGINNGRTGNYECNAIFLFVSGAAPPPPQWGSE
jgi:hypothetical protein